MSILKRLVFREFIGVFMLGSLAIVMLFVIVDFFDRVQRYVGEWGAPLNLLLKFMVFKVPEIVYQMLPLALPLSALIAIGIMHRNRELVAMRAGGVSARSVLTPVFIFALLCAGLLFAIGEYVAPKSNEQLRLVYDEIRRHKMANKASLDGASSKDMFDTWGGWYRGADGFYYINRYEIANDTITGFTFIEMGPGFKIKKRTDVPQVSWNGSKWVGNDVTVREFPTDGTIITRIYPTEIIPIEEKPNDFKASRVTPQEMGFFQLRNYIEKLESGGSDMREFRVDLWSKLSYPLAGFILMVLAAPLGMRKGRGAGLSVGILISLIVCITFYEFNAWMISLGHGGVVSAGVAAWGADVIYGLAGVVAYIRSD